MSLVPFGNSSNRPLRDALLGAVAIVALAGAALENGSFLSTAALADTKPPSAGPASFADVVDKVKGSVVSVKVKLADGGEGDDADAGPVPRITPRITPNSPFEHFFRQFGAPNDEDGEGPTFRGPHHLTQAQGSGFFISADGYIVTNNHVVDHATEVKVTMSDGKVLDAKVIGTDAKTDLALLKVKEFRHALVGVEGRARTRHRFGTL